MLKRIQELRNIGRFQNCRAGGVEFSPLTIIYGRNSYGKSTLGDIFSSISTDNTSLISGRTTIPADGNPQRIRFSVQTPDTTSETEVQFEGDTWIQTFPHSLRVKTFDDGFLHRNLFSARGFTRATKENLSAYILGEQGVQQAREIAEKKKERQQLIRSRNTLAQDAFSRIDDIPTFVALATRGTKDETEEKLLNLKSEQTALLKQQKDTDAIQSRPEGNILFWNDDFNQSVTNINKVLQLGLEGAHNAAKARVTEHITALFQKPQGAERWIREGLNQNMGDACQFCGQALSGEATILLDSYRQAFDEEFDHHEKMVKNKLKEALNLISQLRTDRVRVNLGQNAEVIAKYPELAGRSIFDEARRCVDVASADIQAILAQFDESSAASIARVKSAIDTKLQSPHSSSPTLDERESIALEVCLCEKINVYNKAFRSCIEQFQHYKKSSDPKVLRARLAEITANTTEIETNLSRINLDEQCIRYSSMEAMIARLNAEIPKLEIQLRNSQSDYLQRFFESLNRWFTKFGSQDFTLERIEVGRGHTPIYSLQVKYRNVVINEGDLDKVFSESDRRALALAVFWTQLQELPEVEKAQQIIVLDDPITSFDDGRITAVHHELIAALDHVRQVIVLSHYSHEIRSFCEKYQGHVEFRLLNLEMGPNGTQLVTSDPDVFVCNEHEKVRECLTVFSDGITNECEFGTLRVFFEQELNYRFAAQIAMCSLKNESFSAKIGGLGENNIISNRLMKECHQWRKTLNPAHHGWPTNDLEDKRRTTRSLLEFIYNHLIPA